MPCTPSKTPLPLLLLMLMLMLLLLLLPLLLPLLQVPLSYHLLSCAAFGTAFALDLLAVAFYARSSRLELTLLPAWIKGLPFLSSVLMATGKAVVAEAANGRL
jgi:hypothetical protein